MTLDQILEMPAGHEMNALIAEHIMTGRPALPYSESVCEAWAIVQHMTGRQAAFEPTWPFILSEDRYGGAYSGGRWLASFGVEPCVYDDGPFGEDTDAMDFWQMQLDGWKAQPGHPFGGVFTICRRSPRAPIAAADTPALAICRAALLYVLATEAEDAR